MSAKCLIGVLLAAISAGTAIAQHPIQFKVKLLTVDSNEGCDIGDIDGDGKLDVVAGRNWFRNGEWTPRPVRIIEDRAGYVRSNGEWLIDLNGDQLLDVISIDFVQGGLYWYRNPGPEGLQRGLLWQQRMLVDTKLMTNESCYLVDLDGDRRPEWICDQWNAKNPLIAWSFDLPGDDNDGTDETEIDGPKLVGHRLGNSTGHGIGFGDLNNDQRSDIWVGTGWYECPPDQTLTAAWKFHPAWTMQGACPTLIHDVDGDGINDVIASNAHNYGISLWRGLGVDDQGELRFEKTVIDDSYSQAHCLHLADLDGDGKLELITGKRVRAHNGNDPGGKDAPIVRYYDWDLKAKRFQAHTISQGEVGIGLQIRSADIDNDGDVDLVMAGKDGTQILFNLLK